MAIKMPRKTKCKCKSCGKAGYNTEMYRVVRGGVNTYYCNEDEYLAVMSEKLFKNETFNYIANNVWIVDDPYMIPNSLKKVVNELADKYNYEVVLKTIEKKADVLRNECRIEGKFATDYHMARYLGAIIKNNINPVYEEWKNNNNRINQKQERVKENFDTNLFKDMTENTPTNTNIGSKNDISKFL